MVLFSLHIGVVVDLNKWLPRTNMRSHVVFKLLFALMTSKYRLGPFLHNGVALKRKFGELVEKRYPSTELHLPEHERDGVIPEAVAEAMRQAV